MKRLLVINFIQLDCVPAGDYIFVYDNGYDGIKCFLNWVMANDTIEETISYLNIIGLNYSAKIDTIIDEFCNIYNINIFNLYDIKDKINSAYLKLKADDENCCYLNKIASIIIPNEEFEY